MRKTWSQEEIESHERAMRLQWPDCDVFFASSAGYLAGISERTLHNDLAKGARLEFFRRDKTGNIGTHTNSMRAWGEHHRAAKKKSPKYPFDGGYMTECGGASPANSFPGIKPTSTK
jgi:hypothetical protein